VEITAASAAAQSQANLQDRLAVSVLRKSLDITAEQGAELAKMVAQSGGVGQRVDQYA
jgi:TRAP-type mannitol/chloroaromatic compound transport system substrate-binding protein